jgi:uroporphyrinogen-III synthase
LLAKQLASVSTNGIIIYVSANAVRQAFAALAASGLSVSPAPSLAVGPATAQALRECGLEVAAQAPPPYNSEALLDMAMLREVAGKQVWIIRGNGGRPLLGDTLIARGAEVSYLHAYRRRMPQTSCEKLLRSWTSGGIDVVTVTSNESLSNLYEMVGTDGRALLKTTPLAVVSGRTAALARRLGIDSPVLLAQEASDKAIVDTLLMWRGDADLQEHTRAGRG